MIIITYKYKIKQINTHMQNIKVIFLDWNGTISKDYFWESLKTKNNELFERINKILFIDNSYIINEWMLGNVKINDILNLLSKETKVSQEYLMEELVFSLKQMDFVIPDLKDIIKKIQKNNIKVVLSSGNMDIFGYVVDNLNLKNIFDDISLSNVLKHLKNDIDSNNHALFFHDYIIKNHLKYNECVLIDDSKSLVDMCKKVGMNNIKINDCEKEIRDVLLKFIN